MFHKSSSIFYLLFVLFIGTFISALSINVYAQPIILFGNIHSDLTHRFGDVYPEDNFLNHSVTIYNKGNDTLKIFDIKPGCSCVEATITSRAIPPMDSAIIHLSLNTKGYSGHVSKSIDFITNMPYSPIFNIFLEANVVYPISLNHKLLIFPKCEIGIAQTQSITITNTTDYTISILSSEASDSSISFSLPPQTLQPQQAISFDITYTPEKDTVFRGGIIINFDNPKYKLAKIYISGMPKTK